MKGSASIKAVMRGDVDEARKNDPGGITCRYSRDPGRHGCGNQPVRSGGSSGSRRWDRHYFYCQIGFREPDFDRDPIACNLRTIGKEIEKARQIAKGGIIGVNIMVATQHYEDYVRAAVLAGTDCIISGAGLPLELPGVVAETENGMPGRSHRTMLAPIVSSTVPCRSSRNTG